ncbi:MAG: hypothetical protein HYW49_01110 [Deltaproteobacteria bacterium]|nr:hypothetical protein [Deltaproteobacteria bacterium]
MNLKIKTFLAAALLALAFGVIPGRAEEPSHPVFEVLSAAGRHDIDAAEFARMKEIVLRATGDLKFIELMREPGFRRRFVEANALALGLSGAKDFFDKTGLDALLRMFPDDVSLLNQVFYAKPRSPEDLALFKKRFAEFGFDEKDVLVDPRAELEDGKLYHGTERPNLDKIIQRGAGIFPGGVNARGVGVYGVAKQRVWLTRGFGKFVAEFDVSPEARMLDDTGGNGALLEKRFYEKYPGSHLDVMTDYFGIDILKHKRHTIECVVKNPAILKRPRSMGAGYESFASLVKRASTADSVLRYRELLLAVAGYGPLTEPQLALIVDLLPKPTRLRSYFEQIDRMSGVNPAERLKFKHFGILFDLLFEFAGKGGAEFGPEKTATVLGEHLKAFLWDYREFAEKHAATLSGTIMPLLQRLYLLDYAKADASGLAKISGYVGKALKKLKIEQRRAYLRQLLVEKTHFAVVSTSIMVVAVPVLTALPIYVLSKFIEFSAMNANLVIMSGVVLMALASSIHGLRCELGQHPVGRFCQDTKRSLNDFEKAIKNDPEFCNAMLGRSPGTP